MHLQCGVEAVAQHHGGYWTAAEAAASGKLNFYATIWLRYPFKDARWEGVVIEGFEFSQSTKSPGLRMFQERQA